MSANCFNFWRQSPPAPLPGLHSWTSLETSICQIPGLYYPNENSWSCHCCYMQSYCR